MHCFAGPHQLDHALGLPDHLIPRFTLTGSEKSAIVEGDDKSHKSARYASSRDTAAVEPQPI